jgi:hypothetical protein
VAESAYILIVLLRPWKTQSNEPVPSGSSWVRYGLAAIGGLSIVVAGVLANQWDVLVKTNYGHHVGSLEKVCSTPTTSFSDLEKNYGVQVSLAATSMMGSIVDVRLRIVDPDKAHALLQNQAALLVGQQSLILAPHMHSHNSTRLKAGKTFIIFFPTQQVISPGSQVSLVFGPVRVEPVLVR